MILLVLAVAVGCNRRGGGESGGGTGEPEPAATDPTRVTYAHLAAELSQDYRSPDRTFDGVPRREVLEAASKCDSPQLAKAAAAMLNGLDEEARLLRDKQAWRENLKPRAASLRAGAVHREFKVVLDEWGNSKVVDSYVDADAMAQADNLDALAENSNDSSLSEDGKKLARRLLENHRMSAWTALEPAARESAGPVSAKPLAAVVRKARDSFAIRNVGSSLTNATVLVDFVHHSTMPTVTFTSPIFVPNWPAGQEIALSDTYLTAAGPVGLSQSSLGGVVQTSIRVYAKEASQQLTTVTDAVGVDNVVRARVRELESMIVQPGAVTRPGTTTPAPKESPEVRTQKQVNSQLGTVAPLLAPSHELYGRVQQLVKDFRPVRDELLAVRDAKFLDGFTPGKRYEGTLYNAGTYGMIIVAIKDGGKDVWAELYDPKRPDAGRLFGGAVVDDRFSSRKALVLSAVASAPGGFAEPIQTIVGRVDDPTNPSTVKLRWRLSKLRFDKGGDRENSIASFVTFVPVAENPAQFAAAVKRLEARQPLKAPEIGPIVPATRPVKEPGGRPVKK
jgi:hypothetical protein